MKKLFVFIFMLSLSISLLAYSFFNPIGPALLPAAGLYSENIPDLTKDYWRTLDEAQILALKQQADFLVLPVAYGAELISKGFEYSLAGVSIWKSFYLVTSQEVKSIEDLRGKRIVTIHSPGQTGDLILKMITKQKNINFETVYVNSGADIIQLLATGKETMAVLPEPFVSLAEVKTKNAITAKLDLQQVYAQLTGYPAMIPITGLFVSNKVPREYAQKIIDKYEQSSNTYFKDEFDKSIKFMFDLMDGKMPDPVLRKASQRSFIEFGKDKEVVLGFLKILKENGAISDYKQDMFF